MPSVTEMDVYLPGE